MENFTPDNDSKLSSEWNTWHDFKRGNRQAFERLYKDYFQILNNYGSRLTSDGQLREDAIHDVFIDLWRRKEYLADVENIRFYLFRALRNRIIRNGKNIFENKDDIDKFLDYLVSLSYEEQSIDSERMQDKTTRIQHAISNLSDRQREVINLRFYHALSLDEISILMGLSKQCVSNLLFKSYAVLRLNLRELSMLSTLTSLLASQC